MKHDAQLAMYYRPDMAPPEVGSFSQSPTKPRRFVEFLRRTPVWPHVTIESQFSAVTRGDLLIAHRESYVDAFLHAHDEARAFELDLAESNGITWTPDFRDSVMCTNGSLVAAVDAVIRRPATIAMSPASGFHHATPESGQGYCTFSGQVIAAVRAWEAHRARGAWIDLDGHFGNSIEDSREYVLALREAIPEGCNLNVNGAHGGYLAELARKLDALGSRVAMGEVTYVGVAHGADSHEWDSLGHQCSTAEWLEASRLVYTAIRSWSSALGRPVPVVLALFGGYRNDHPESVLGLHAMDTARALGYLADVRELVDYHAEVRPPA